MQLVFQIAAVVVVAIAAVLLLRGGGARHQALRRVALLLFIVAAASSVFFPAIWTWMANLVGIGRGADLLLYLLVLTFLGFVASTYRRFRLLENQITLLSRELALANATTPSSSGNDADTGEEKQTE